MTGVSFIRNLEFNIFYFDLYSLGTPPVKEVRHLLYAGEPLHRNGLLLTFPARSSFK